MTGAKDRNGVDLKPGDQVVITCEVMSMRPDELGGRVMLRVLGSNDLAPIFMCDSRAVEVVEAADGP